MQPQNTNYTYREASTKKLFFGYQCSACREKQVATKEIVSAVYYTDIGCRGSLVLREERAKERLKVREKKNLDRFLSAYDRGVYRKLDLRDTCMICGHKEPWTRFYPKTARNLMILAAFLELLLLLSILFIDHTMPRWSLLVLPGLLLLGGAAYLIYCKALEYKIARLDCRALPRLLAGEQARADFLAGRPYAAVSGGMRSEGDAGSNRDTADF